MKQRNWIIGLIGMVLFSIAFSSAIETKAEESEAAVPTPLVTVNPFIEVKGEKKQSGIFTYDIRDAAGNAAIRDVNTTSEKLVIPSEIDGHKVTIIDLEPYSGDKEFEWKLQANEASKNYVKELVIPEGIKEIRKYSFYNFSNLEKIKIGKGVVIGDAAFGPSKVKELTLENICLERANFSSCKFDKIIWKGTGGIISESFRECEIGELHISSPKFNGYVSDIFSDTKIDKMYAAKGIKTLIFGYRYFYENKLNALYVNDLKTRLVIKDLCVLRGQITFGTIYTVSGAKMAKDARKNKIDYKVKKTGKTIKYQAEKKNGAYRGSWAKIKTTVSSYRYNKKKKTWSSKRNNLKTVYKVYGKKKKAGTYKWIKTTTKRKIASKYKYIKVKPDGEW